MAEYSASRARDQFSELINQAAYGRERVVLTRRGKKIVAIVPIEDLERIEQLEDEEDARDVAEALKALKDGTEKTIPWKKVKHNLGWE